MQSAAYFTNFIEASLYLFWGWEGVNHGVRLAFLMPGAASDVTWGSPPMVERCFGESSSLWHCSLTRVLLEAGLEVKKHGEENKSAGFASS